MAVYAWRRSRPSTVIIKKSRKFNIIIMSKIRSRIGIGEGEKRSEETVTSVFDILPLQPPLKRTLLGCRWWAVGVVSELRTRCRCSCLPPTHAHTLPAVLHLVSSFSNCRSPSLFCHRIYRNSVFILFLFRPAPFRFLVLPPPAPRPSPRRLRPTVSNFDFLGCVVS